MPISGISHLTFPVRDLDRTARMLVEGLGAPEVYDGGDRPHSLSREKFFVRGGAWLVAMEGEPPAERSDRQVAFRIDARDPPGFRARLDALGVDIRPSRPRIEGEGGSLYFRALDALLFELHTGSLDARLSACGVPMGRVPARRGGAWRVQSGPQWRLA